jgi:negative regulator of replication initiation
MSNEFKSFSQIPPRPKESVESIGSRERIKIHTPNPKEPVVGSETGYKPIDRVAARVVMPASDICRPPRPPPVFMSKNITSQSETDFTSHEKFPESREGASVRGKRQFDRETGKMEEMLNMNDVAVMATDTHMHTVKDGAKQSEELVAKCQDVIAAIDYLATQMKGPYTEFRDFAKSALAEVREQRIALGTETRQLMNALKEVRQFFFENDYEEQMRRLREFIDLCERLKTLKEEGFVDALVDTILKL